MDDRTKIHVASEYGRLNAVLLHRPGDEIERMTPSSAAEALYSDILSKHIVDKEYAAFCGVLEKWTKVYYVEDVLTELMENDDARQRLVMASCEADGCHRLAEELMLHDSRRLAKELIEGVPYHADDDPDSNCPQPYMLKPLYNLFFTRDASSSVYDEVLINSMSFPVRERETLLYESIFKDYFGTHTFSVRDTYSGGRSEGGDVQIAAPDVLCIGNGIRTNTKGIQALVERYAQRYPHFNVVVQELPEKPDSFIHLDMVFTFLGSHQCMAYQPMLTKTGFFSNKDTYLFRCDNGKVTRCNCKNILEGLKLCGMEMEPVFCGAGDICYQDREQWHSGANFFALGDGKVIGYERNQYTIEALCNAGFSILDAEDVCDGSTDLYAHEKFVVTFRASELPRGGGGARCMTMPINRD